MGLLLVPATLSLGTAAFIAHRVHQTLRTAADSVRRRSDLPFELHTLASSNGLGFEPVSSAGFEHAVTAGGELYVSGAAGITVYNADGTPRHTWRTGIDLPAGPVRVLAAGRLRNSDGLAIIAATAGEGIVLFEQGGKKLQQLRPSDPGLREITALLPMPGGDLLLGTRNRGVLVWTGDHLRPFQPQLTDQHVTALAAGAGVWVGTRDAGLLHWTGGTAESFSAPDALPDADVESLAADGKRVFAGTPLGVREFVDGRPARLLAPDIYAAALLVRADDLLVASVDQGTRDAALEPASHPRHHPFMPILSGDVRAFTSSGDDGTDYAVLRDRILRTTPGGRWEDFVHTPEAALTDTNISSLGFDGDGRLWVGYFDRGIDILDHDHTTHIEDDHVFCINRLRFDPERGNMLAATANGLVVFDRAGKPRQVLKRRDGLISDHVTDIAFHPGGMTLATSAGLTFMDAGSSPASLYAFQGLVNNHVYALATQPDGRALAGTLGGLSLLKDERVTRNFTVANSGLKHNWITAITAEPGGWSVGTYGGGVLEVSAAGTITPRTAPFVVNPNAMLRTPSHLLVGTLDDGLWVESLPGGRWTQITAGLPSRNVTAFAEHDGTLYIGTDAGLVTLSERKLP